VSAFRAGADRLSSHGTPGILPGTVRIYAAGLGFLGLGQIEATGRLVPLRLIFVSLISTAAESLLRASAATRTNARLLKGLSY